MPRVAKRLPHERQRFLFQQAFINPDNDGFFTPAEQERWGSARVYLVAPLTPGVRASMILVAPGLKPDTRVYHLDHNGRLFSEGARKFDVIFDATSPVVALDGIHWRDTA